MHDCWAERHIRDVVETEIINWVRRFILLFRFGLDTAPIKLQGAHAIHVIWTFLSRSQERLRFRAHDPTAASNVERLRWKGPTPVVWPLRSCFWHFPSQAVLVRQPCKMSEVILTPPRLLMKRSRRHAVSKGVFSLAPVTSPRVFSPFASHSLSSSQNGRTDTKRSPFDTL
jgi:hypothetical protein